MSSLRRPGLHSSCTPPAHGLRPSLYSSLWKDVTFNLKIRDIDAATEAKHRLEERQRAEARERKEKEVQWETRVSRALLLSGVNSDSSMPVKDAEMDLEFLATVEWMGMAWDKTTLPDQMLSSSCSSFTKTESAGFTMTPY